MPNPGYMMPHSTTVINNIPSDASSTNMMSSYMSMISDLQKELMTLKLSHPEQERTLDEQAMMMKAMLDEQAQIPQEVRQTVSPISLRLHTWNPLYDDDGALRQVTDVGVSARPEMKDMASTSKPSKDSLSMETQETMYTPNPIEQIQDEFNKFRDNAGSMNKTIYKYKTRKFADQVQALTKDDELRDAIDAPKQGRPKEGELGYYPNLQKTVSEVITANQPGYAPENRRILEVSGAGAWT